MNKERNINTNSKFSTAFDCYPLVFHPLFKDRIWGGNKLSQLGKNIQGDHVGESWEIAMVDEDVTLVATGKYQGVSLSELIERFPIEILGTKVYSKFGKQFPLLFKFLDAKTDLSIQLHPNDELAKKRHNSYGKTEMWYVLQADAESRVILGFEKNSSATEYKSHLKNKTLPSVLKSYEVSAGDVFLIETGTIHAIGGGILLAEIQQPSDITYRVYDWDRADENGKFRELHVDLALDAIDYKCKESKITYQKNPNVANKLVHCEFFTTNFIELTQELSVNKNNESFLVYICLEGEANLLLKNKEPFVLSKGMHVLLPASITNFTWKGKAKLIEVYIN